MSVKTLRKLILFVVSIVIGVLIAVVFAPNNANGAMPASPIAVRAIGYEAAALVNLFVFATSSFTAAVTVSVMIVMGYSIAVHSGFRLMSPGALIARSDLRRRRRHSIAQAYFRGNAAEGEVLKIG